eukprot:m51a1_g2868 putative D-tagaturonate epimerase (381) ;mRNA; f:359496-362151
MEHESTFKQLPKFSVGVGDRFGREGVAQLRAMQMAAAAGLPLCPIIGTKPADTRRAADEAVKAAGWTGPYFVDADHISMANVDPFIDHSDFFTIDVAANIGKPADAAKMQAFVEENAEAAQSGLRIAGIERAIVMTREDLRKVAARFLRATEAAGETYRHVAQRRAGRPFAVEVSMDEVPEPQTPGELYYVVKLLAAQRVPLQTLAPKFTGRFNKGVDYVGDAAAFAREFEEDALVLAHCAREFGLPAGLKLSVHSGSDKFALYPLIGAALRKTGRGVHLKTAGTTWLEECVGLASSGDDEAVAIVRDVCVAAMGRIDELCAPYADVIDIRRERLPSVEELRGWSGERDIRCRKRLVEELPAAGSLTLRDMEIRIVYEFL